MKRDIKQLLKKGLTGKEAARLILEDSWEVDHDREGFLSRQDIDTIRRSLTNHNDIQEYNKWVDTYRIIDFSNKEATILALDVARRMYHQMPAIYQFVLDWKVGMIKHWLPQVVTEKQYQDIKARQREDLLEDKTDFWNMLESWAWQIDVHIEWEEGDEESPVYLHDFLTARYPELFGQWLDRLLELIQAGKLKPVLLRQEDREKLDKIEDKIKTLRDKRFSPEEPEEEKEERIKEGGWPPPGWTEQDEEEWAALIQERDSLLEQAREAAASQQSEDSLASIVAALEELKAGTLTEEADRLLDWTEFSVRELYEAGLPEWVEWVDEFKTNFSEDYPAYYYAIVQEPDEYKLDERGYWKEDKGLDSISELDDLYELWGTDGPGLKDYLKAQHKVVRAQLKNFLAGRAIMEVVSELIGVSFMEDLERLWQDVLLAMEQYNALVKVCNRLAEKYPLDDRDRYLSLPLLRPKMLKPDKDEIDSLKDRVAMSLGAEWAEEADKLLERTWQEEESDGQG